MACSYCKYIVDRRFRVSRLISYFSKSKNINPLYWEWTKVYRCNACSQEKQRLAHFENLKIFNDYGGGAGEVF